MVISEYFGWTYKFILWLLGVIGVQDNMDLDICVA